MAKNKIFLLTFSALLLLGIVSFVFAAPVFNVQRSIIPEATDQYYIGTSTPSTLEWNGLYVKNITISGTCIGCTSLTGGGINQITYWDTATSLKATSSPTSSYFIATSTNNASVFPIASTTSLSIGNLLNVSGIGTSTFTGGLSAAGFDSSRGLRVSTGDTILAGGLQVIGGSNFTGNVGIGTTSPGALLAVNGSILAQTGTSTFGGLISPTLFSTTTLGFYTASNDAPRVTIDTLGNVGIGTTNPQQKLDVQGIASSTTFYANNGAVGTPAYAFASSINTGMYWDGSSLNFATAGSRRFYAGTGGLGVTPGIDVNGWWTISGAASGGIGFGSGHVINWGSATTNGGTTGDAGFARNAAGVLKVTNGTTGFGTLLAGTIGIGTTSPGATLSVTGSGIINDTLTIGGTLKATSTALFATEGGSVGIGTIAPIGTLDLSNNADRQIFIGASSDPGWTNPAIQLGNAGAFYSRNTSVEVMMAVNEYYDGSRRNLSNAGGAAMVANNTDGFALQTASSPGAAGNVFSYFNRLIVTIAGKVGIGEDAPSHLLEVKGTVAFTSLSTGAGNGALCMSTAGLVSYDAGANCIISSKRFKNNISDLTVGLDEVMKLRPVTYEYNKDLGFATTTPQVGFIAEEVQQVDPRLVILDASSTPYSVRYENFTAVLAKAIQEMENQISYIWNKLINHETRIQILEKQNADLQAKITKICQTVVCQ